MEWYHQMRTGSKKDFEDSTKEGFIALAGVLFIAIFFIYGLCRICGKEKKKSEEKKEWMIVILRILVKTIVDISYF